MYLYFFGSSGLGSLFLKASVFLGDLVWGLYFYKGSGCGYVLFTGLVWDLYFYKGSGFGFVFIFLGVWCV